jgi:hypothetical protein
VTYGSIHDFGCVNNYHAEIFSTEIESWEHLQQWFKGKFRQGYFLFSSALMLPALDDLESLVEHPPIPDGPSSSSLLNFLEKYPLESLRRYHSVSLNLLEFHLDESGRRAVIQCHKMEEAPSNTITNDCRGSILSIPFADAHDALDGSNVEVWLSKYGQEPTRDITILALPYGEMQELDLLTSPKINIPGWESNSVVEAYRKRGLLFVIVAP